MIAFFCCGTLALMPDPGISVHFRMADDGKAALHVAAEHGSTAAARQLLASGAAVDLQDLLGGWTAMHYAAAHQQTEVVELVRTFQLLPLASRFPQHLLASCFLLLPSPFSILPSPFSLLPSRVCPLCLLCLLRCPISSAACHYLRCRALVDLTSPPTARCPVPAAAGTPCGQAASGLEGSAAIPDGTPTRPTAAPHTHAHEQRVQHSPCGL